MFWFYSIVHTHRLKKTELTPHSSVANTSWYSKCTRPCGNLSVCSIKGGGEEARRVGEQTYWHPSIDGQKQRLNGLCVCKQTWTNCETCILGKTLRPPWRRPEKLLSRLYPCRFCWACKQPTSKFARHVPYDTKDVGNSVNPRFSSMLWQLTCTVRPHMYKRLWFLFRLNLYFAILT